MDTKNTNPYSTEIPVNQAEQEIAHTTTTETPVSSPGLQDQSTEPSGSTQASQTAPPQMSPARMHTSILPKLIIGFFVLAIIGLSSYILSVRLSPTSTTASPKPTLTPVPTTTPTTPTPVPENSYNDPDLNSSKRFTTRELGILFDTAKTLPDTNEPVNTLLSDNKIYVFINGTTPTDGQYVEVLPKLSTDDVTTAAQKTTTGNPTFENCTFKLVTQNIFPASYQKAVPTCPMQTGGGISFFLADTQHPTKLLYVSIGQYTIPSGTNMQKPWQDTIRFLPEG